MFGFILTICFIGYVWYRIEKKLETIGETVKRHDNILNGRC